MRSLAILLVLGAACGSDVGSATAPQQHRPTATACAANPGASPADQCTTDADCADGGVCSCKGQTRGFAGASPNNVCITAGCRVDADCGAGAVCSPTTDAQCGAFFGIRGYYCHRASDACGNDSDCTDEPNGHCSFDLQSGRWGCFYTFCAG